MRKWSVISLIGVAGFTAGVLVALISKEPAPVSVVVPAGAVRAAVTPGPVIKGRRRPDFRFEDQDGRMRNIGDWDGQWVVVNFWATWCPPCLHEIPVFIDLQREFGARGVQFVGVALDEPDNVRAFAREAGMNYPSMSAQQESIDLLRAYGNAQGGLPYTVLVSPEGKIVYTKSGALTRQEAEQLLSEHLASS